MKRIPIMVYALFLGALVLRGWAQEINPNSVALTLQEAVKSALRNYTAITIQQKAIDRAQGLKSAAGLLPNPSLTYYRENLSLNGVDGGEWIISGSLPLNFLWTRWSKVSAASNQVEAEQLLLADVRRQIKFEVQKAYVETHFAEQNVQAWQKAAAVFDRAAKASFARFKDGDLSGYDQQRIALEHLRYQKAAAEAQIRLKSSRGQLTFLLDPDQTELRIQTSADFPASAGEISQDRLFGLAMENRPDLQAAKAALRSRESSFNANRLLALPDITAILGYKEEADNFKGSVIQINFSVPIFDRNQGGIQSARADFDRQILATRLLEKRVALEVKQAYEIYLLYRKQVEQYLKQHYRSPEEFLETAVFSYNEGEIIS